MTDRTSVIFGNPIDEKTIRQAEKARQKYIGKYGDDTAKQYVFGTEDIPTLDFIGAKKLVFADQAEPLAEPYGSSARKEPDRKTRTRSEE